MEKSYFLYENNKNIGLIKYSQQQNTIKITYFSINSEFQGNKLGKKFLKDFIEKMKCDMHLDAYGEIGKETKLFTYYEDIGFQKNGKQYIKSTNTGDYIVQPMIKPYNNI